MNNEDQVQTAIQYLAQVCEDYIQTLRPSAAGPVSAQAQQALKLVVEATKARNKLND